MKVCVDPLVADGVNTALRAIVEVSDDLLLNLEHLKINISADYYASFRRPIGEVARVSASEYLYGDREHWKDQTLLCPEMALPGAWTYAVRVILPAGIAWSKSAIALIHAGRQGCMAPVHFDWDHSWVVHACLTGRKRLFFFPPEAGWLLCPIINTSALCIPRLSASDRQDLLARLGGFGVVLEAGQGVLFPSVFWHGALYEESSLSMSLRFECSPGGRPFAVLPRSWLLQRLIWQFFKTNYGAESMEFLQSYMGLFFEGGASWEERYQGVNALCQRALLERGEQKGAAGLVGENFSAELALASEELETYYGDVSTAQSPDSEIVRETTNYLFDGISTDFSHLGTRLALHSLRVRQGLPPKRGLIRIEAGQEDLCRSMNR